MKVKRIVCPTDFSPYGDAALLHATALARGTEAEVLLVHVKEPPIGYAIDGGLAGLADVDDDYLLAKLEQLPPSDSDVRYRFRLLKGVPAKEIALAAENEQADLIVMGTHGRTGLSHVLMGSVAEKVVRKAPCPVLTVKLPDSANLPSSS